MAILGGPALFLLGETLFRVRMIRSANLKRVTAIAGLAALGLFADTVSALALATLVAAVLVVLAMWDYGPTRPGAPAEG